MLSSWRVVSASAAVGDSAGSLYDPSPRILSGEGGGVRCGEATYPGLAKGCDNLKIAPLHIACLFMERPPSSRTLLIRAALDWLPPCV